MTTSYVDDCDGSFTKNSMVKSFVPNEHAVFVPEVYIVYGPTKLIYEVPPIAGDVEENDTVLPDVV